MRHITLTCLMLASAGLHALVPLTAHAHGSGMSFEKTMDGYFVDVGYDVLGIRPNEPGRFDFQLWKQSPTTTEAVEFDSVNVRISRLDEAAKNPIVFESRVDKAPLGYTGMVYAFPESGDYTLAVGYMNADTIIVEAEFPLTVDESQGFYARFIEFGSLGVAGIAFVSLMAVGWFVLRDAFASRRSKSS